MDISYNWLKDLIEIESSPKVLADELTLIGLELDGFHESEDDTIFDIEITSNRGDCLSHLGVAREIGALKNRDLHLEKYDAKKPANEKPNLVTIVDSDLCHRFTARIIRNVKIGESPGWLKKRLEAVGERSINNVADITNYVMLELGQPMHAFDLNKLAENRIVVRRAKNGEVFKTLDEIERKLDETMLAICDAEKPVAIGGVMGGFDSGITEETTDVLLEVAYFESDNIRQTSRKLSLSTEASYRFERGVDIENLIRASNRATELICQLAGGEAGEFADNYPTKFIQSEIESNDINYAVKRLSGLDVETERCLQILGRLGIRSNSAIGNSQPAIFTAPTWRHDLAIEEDLVEEVVRIVGYGTVGEELPAATSSGGYQPHEMRKKHLRQTLAIMGFNEAISYSFIDEKHDETFDLIPNLFEEYVSSKDPNFGKFIKEHLKEKLVSIKDPIIEGSTRMRPTLLSGLLDAVRVNFNHKKRDVKLFELGKVFSASNKENGLPVERELFSIVITGNEILQNKAMPVREFDFYDAKGAVETAIHALNLPELDFLPCESKHLRKGQSAEIFLNGKTVGTIGRLNDEISSGYKFKQPVFVSEIDLETLLEAKEQDVLYYPLPVFPSIVRDVSFLINRSNGFAEIKNSILKENYELLRSIEFVDVYEGKGVSDDERSITIRFEYRSDERTLLEDEIETIHKQILQLIETKFEAKQRV